MSKNVVVIGGGVIGLSAAAECARRGHRVVVIERAPEQRGASLGNAGMIVPSHFIPLAAPGMVALGLKWMWNPESPFYIKPRLNWDLFAWALRFWKASTREHVARAAPLLRDLHLASRDAYLRLAQDADDFGLVTKGLLMLCKTEQALEEEAHTATRARELGLPAELLNAKQIAALEPNVTMDIAGGVYFPKDCHLQPERYIATLERRVEERGGKLMFGVDATGWRIEGRRIVALQTTKGDIAGDEFILAGGAWSPQLLGSLRLRLPMQPGKGYSITIPEPIELPQICAILTEARVAVTPMNKALRFGGTMEIAGLNATINARRVQGIISAACLYFPRFAPDQFAALQPWQGIRPCSPDGLPYLGRARAAPTNLVIATGHAMMGLSLAPVTGEIAGQLVDGEPPRFDLKLLSPDRYHQNAERGGVGESKK